LWDYASLSIRGDHVVISKEKGKPNGKNHINSIEGFWSYAKHWLYQYRVIPNPRKLETAEKVFILLRCSLFGGTRNPANYGLAMTEKKEQR